MTQEKDDLGKIYSDIESIENKIGNLQGELNHLKSKLDLYVQKTEKPGREEFVVDKTLEEELTAPITGYHEIVSSDPIPELKSKQPEITQPVTPKIVTPRVEIIRPSLITNTPTKKEEINASVKSPESVARPIIQKPAISTEAPPDIFDDLKNWVKGKIGNIPVEEFVGVNLLNKIGLLLLVVGFSFFLRLAYDWIGPYTKIIGMLLLSAGVFVGGDRLYKNKSYSIFGLGMIASSFAVFYFTVYASYNIEATRIIDKDQGLLGFILLLMASGVVIGASLRYKMEALTSFAYFLGFLTISINEKADFNYFSMISVAILSVSLIGIMTVMRWKYLTGVGILASYANYWLYANGLPRTAEGYLLRVSETGQNYYLESILYLLFFWIIFFISTFTMKIEDKRTEKICSAINIVNAFSFFVMLGHVRPEPTEWGPFTLNMSMGILYLIGAFAGRKFGREFLWKSSIILGISLITLAIPAKFSDYGHVFGWLMEGTVLIVLGFLYKESYLKNMGYLVLFLNLGRFFTLPYSDFFYSSTIAYPLLTFDMNRGMIYIFMLASFYGLIPFLRNYRPVWTPIDKFAYNSFGFLASLTLFLFSFYLIQKPYQAYVIIPASGLVLYLAIHFRNRNLYYSSAGLTALSLLVSIELLFQSSKIPNQIHEIISFSLILLGNGFHYYFARENSLINRYCMEGRSARHQLPQLSFHLKSIFLNGEIFLWAGAISIVGLVLNEVSAYYHTVCILVAAYIGILLQKKYAQGIKQSISLFCVAFLVGIYRYGIFNENRGEELNAEAWIAITNLFVFWSSGIGILWFQDKLNLAQESRKIISPILISATTLTAMMIGNILIKDPYLLCFAAIYSLALVGSYVKLKDEFCVYNSLLLSWFSLILGFGGMILQKQRPESIYEYMNLITYTISSVMTTVLVFQLISKKIERTLFYVQSIITCISFIFFVIPKEYIPIAMAILHLSHLLFLFKFEIEEFYDYSYMTLSISTLLFFMITPKVIDASDYKSISLIVGYSLLSVLQSVYIFWNDTKARDRYIYYILTSSVLFWSIHITAPLEYAVLLFAVLVYANSILLSRFEIKEIEKLYYYPLLLTMFSFLYFIFSDKPSVLEEMNYKDFTLGLFTLFLLLRGVKEAENYKSTQPDFKQEKYSFDRIVTLILFLEFILLTMTVVDIRWWSLIWTIEAMAFIGYGVFRSQPLIRYAGIGLIALAVVKIGFWDLQNLKENTRVLVLISIGGLFVVASFLYAKFKDRLFKEEN
jgi:hypothetical protein